MRRCCIIYNEPLPGALEDELDVIDQVIQVEQGMKDLGIDVYRKGITAKFMDEVSELVTEKPDFVFNLVESINNKGELNYFVPALLNLHGIPYSGNSHEAIFQTTSKILTSRILKMAGIPNPECFLPSQMHLLKPGIKYILKPIWEDGSLGITADSVFVCKPGYEEKLKGLSDSHWFIEEFIDGREFNMSVLADSNGPEVMPLAEIVFVGYDETRPRIIDYKAKWDINTFEYDNTVRDFPGEKLDSEVIKKLRKIALDSWKLFGLKGYARVDARVDNNNNVFVIEINANPCIQPNGGFMAATREGGYSFPVVLERIIEDLNT
ncbi:MAG TPA: ATP-grasp domain-containing protein [Bacteroidales bacterium]|nr:ATP-grasp domain-containing protein [Bacteroidales bacterium]